MMKLLALVATGLCVVAADEGVFSVPLSHSWDGKPEEAQAFIEKVQAHNAKVYSRKSSVANGALQPTAFVEETGGGDSLSNHQTFFTGQIKVGSNNQVFDVIFDTGSSKLVIPSTYCGQPGCINHRQFDPAASTSYVSCTSEEDRAKGMYKAETTEYGSGSVTGVLGADVVHMAPNCDIDNLVFGQIMEERGDIFLASAFDGVMGMGPPDPKFVDKEEDVTYVIHKQHGLPKNVYSFYFTNRPSNKGELIFGADGNNHQGSFTSLTSMNPDPNNWAYWEVQMTDVKVGGVSIGACGGSQKCTAILDTGTTLVVGPGRVLGAVNSRASVNSDCSNLGDLPTVTFQLDGHDFTLNPEDYVLSQPGQFWGGSSSCVSGFTNEDNPFDFQRSGALGLMKHSHNATVENTVLLQEEVDEDGDTVSLDDAKVSHSKLSAGGMAQNLAAHRQKRADAEAQTSYAQRRLAMKQVLENSAKRTYSFERAKSTASNARVILGITFLKKYVSVFDYDTGKIRLATANHPNNDKPFSASELKH